MCTWKVLEPCATTCRSSGMTVRVAVIGTGFIGGSIGLALTRLGSSRSLATTAMPNGSSGPRPWAQSPRSRARSTTRRAALRSWSSRCPVGQVVDAAIAALDAGAAVVTDVGSVKGPVVAALEAARRGRGCPIRRRPSDGRIGARGRRRGRRRFVRRGDVGAHADAGDGCDGVHAVARARSATSVPRS